MRAERGGSRNLARSFVQHANKENSLFSDPSSVPRSQIPSSRRRRSRIVVADSTSALSRRHHRGTILPQPAHDNEQMISESEIPTQRRITLPRELSRPMYRPIDPRNITAVDPVLENIPLAYIQYSLEEIGPQLLSVTSNATATPPSGQLPREIEIICNNVSIEPPSHVLAVYSRTGAPRCGVTLFPAHALILATNCANLPDLPESRPSPPAEAGGTVTLPIVPLRIPSTATFSTLLSYLYTKRSDHLLEELLPLGEDEAMSFDQLSRKHAAACTAKTLSEHMRKVHSLWSNAAVLGIFDDKLFRTLEIAWEVLLGALDIGFGASVVGGIEVDEE